MKSLGDLRHVHQPSETLSPTYSQSLQNNFRTRIPSHITRLLESYLNELQNKHTTISQGD